MQKLLVIILIIFILILGYFAFKPIKSVPDYSNKLDSLELQILSIKDKRDSIKKEIDTVIIKIEKNEIYYKQIVDTIIRNNVDDDYIFFCEYLRKRFDDNNNPDSIKEN